MVAFGAEPRALWRALLNPVVSKRISDMAWVLRLVLRWTMEVETWD